MSSFAQTFGLLAGVLSFVGAVVYASTILINGTRPFRATWVVWLVQGVIIAMSYKAAGGTVGLWKAWADVLGYAVILLAIGFRGKSGWTILDVLCLMSAGFGLFLWAFTEEPTVALYLTLGIDFVGWLPTAVKTAIKPESENRFAWTLWVINSALSVVAVFSAGNHEPAIVIYPLYFLGSNITIWALSLRKTPAHKLAPEG